MAAALWGLDFMFTLAQSNAAGINLETGVNHLGFLSWYTPIGVSPGNTYRATPLYYGMFAFAMASRGERLPLKLDPVTLNLTAYAVRSGGGEVWLTVVNKDARDAHVRATCPGVTGAHAVRLTAPSITSKEGVLLGESPVASDGRWNPRQWEPVRVTSGEMEITIPGATAALLRMR
jgi:hypothetical protein